MKNDTNNIFLGGLFKIYTERKVQETADYVIDADADFGAGHLQHAVLPGTVRFFLYNQITSRNINNLNKLNNL